MIINLLLTQYNNYFNRIVKRESGLDDYLSASRAKYLIQVNNWNPNDGVMTEQIINWNEEWNPDYLIAFNDFKDIVSRWFITESVRTRGGQYRLTLKRDVIVDNYELIIKAPCFIQKASLDFDNPLIFNKENFQCNQIKVSETPLHGGWPVGWYAIFYDKSLNDSDDASNPLKGSFVTTAPEDINALELQMTSSELPTSVAVPTDAQYGIVAKNLIKGGLIYEERRYYFNSSGDMVNSYVTHNIDNSPLISIQSRKFTEENIKNTLNVNSTLNALLNAYIEDPNGHDLDFINSIKGRYVKTTDNRYFKVKVFAPSPEREIEDNPPADSAIYLNVLNRFKPGGELVSGFGGDFNTKSFRVYRKVQTYNIVYDPVEELQGNYDLRANGKNQTDASYGVVLLPFADVAIPGKLAYWYNKPLNAEVNRTIIAEVLRKSATQSSSIYDIQIIPYCPYQEFVTLRLDGAGWDLVESLWEPTMYRVIEDNNSAKQTLAVFPNSISFTRNLKNFSIARATDAIERKINNQVDMFRLCSPNFNGQFEFSAERNDGVDMFNVDVTMKPYQSYIHVNPVFKKLYGSDFNDPRGLVCGGDLSLTRTVDAWENYKLQNKNYEAIFDRQIQNMDFSHNMAMLNAGFSVLGGAFAGAAGGAMLTGGSPIGAAAGAAASVAGGIGDLFLGKKKYEEQKDFVTDIHNYQLENIQALPTTLSKVDALNNNFKVWPVIEKYTCTDEEREAMRNLIEYEGMTVNGIWTIESFLKSERTFIKGQIIRLDGIGDDSHLAYEIYNEISKGVYI